MIIPANNVLFIMFLWTKWVNIFNIFVMFHKAKYYFLKNKHRAKSGIIHFKDFWNCKMPHLYEKRLSHIYRDPNVLDPLEKFDVRQVWR